MQHNAPSGHTGEQEPSGPGHRTGHTRYRAGTLVNRSQVVQDTVHATKSTMRADPAEQEPSGTGHPTRNTTHRASTPVNSSQVAQDTAHATQRTERAHRLTGAEWCKTPHTQHNAPSGHTCEQEPSCPGHRTRDKTHRAGTPVNRSQVAQNTAHATQRTERAHQLTGAKWSKTPHTQHNTPSGHTGEQEPSGPEHRTRNTRH